MRGTTPSIRDRDPCTDLVGAGEWHKYSLVVAIESDEAGSR